MFLGEWGLSLSGNKAELGKWLEKIADNHFLLVKASMERFRDCPNIGSYLAICENGKKEWQKLKPQIAKIFREKGLPKTTIEQLVNIEQMAIELQPDKNCPGEWNMTLIVHNAIKLCPEWLIRVADKQAQRFIARRKSNHYDAAILWLTKMKLAYKECKKQREWKEYLKEIKQQHKRKSSLLEKLKSLE